MRSLASNQSLVISALDVITFFESFTLLISARARLYRKKRKRSFIIKGARSKRVQFRCKNRNVILPIRA